jgi:DNA transposition AAA+ family ATPase
MSEHEIENVAGKSETAEAASAHSRINVPLNLSNWKDLAQDIQEVLVWFHQHILDSKLNWTQAAEALGYDNTTIFRVLKGSYEGSWKNVCGKITSYKKIVETRGTIQQNEFVPNDISKLVAGGLDYALANNSITMIIGESRMGKTVSAIAWRNDNNHGRSVYVAAPPYGGTKMFLRRLAEAVGVNRNQSTPALLESVCRSFNRHRILIVDEAHRLLPADHRANPVNLEILRDIHDTTHCALALIATQRVHDDLQKGQYQFEQLLGRIGMPVRLRRRIAQREFRPIVEQYLKHPSDKVMDVCNEIANHPGRLGILVETFKMASRISGKAKEKVSEEHFFKAVAIRRQMMGETVYAKKED